MPSNKADTINKYVPSKNECREDDNSGCPVFVDKEEISDKERKNQNKITATESQQDNKRPQ